NRNPSSHRTQLPKTARTAVSRTAPEYHATRVRPDGGGTRSAGAGDPAGSVAGVPSGGVSMTGLAGAGGAVPFSSAGAGGGGAAGGGADDGDSPMSVDHLRKPTHCCGWAWWVSTLNPGP